MLRQDQSLFHTVLVGRYFHTLYKKRQLHRKLLTLYLFTQLNCALLVQLLAFLGNRPLIAALFPSVVA